MIEKTPATTPPTVPGWYVVWIPWGRPTVLWWGASSTEWRAGCVLQNVTHYAGPLPE